MKRFLFAAIFVFSLLGVSAGQAAAEFYGDFPTGLLELEKKYPYYLYVPPDYSPEKVWPLVLLLGERGEDPKERIGPWVEWAKENHFLVLAPPNVTPEKDVPTLADQWLFEVKREVGERYRINPAQVLLVGLDSGAHYAAYLATRYPEEFSAAALVRRAWPGPYERLAVPVSEARKHVSFYLAVDPKAGEFSQIEASAVAYEGKGYRIAFDPLKPDEDFAKLRGRMIQWFREDAEARSALKERPRVTQKEKFKGFLHDFFEV